MDEDDYGKFRLERVKPSRCIEASFYIIENILDFFTANGFRRQLSMKLFYEYIVIFFNLSPTSNHLHSLRVENCGSNSRLVVDWKGQLKRVIIPRSLFPFYVGCLCDAVYQSMTMFITYTGSRCQVLWKYFINVNRPIGYESKGVYTASESGRYTFSYPRGHIFYTSVAITYTLP